MSRADPENSGATTAGGISTEPQTVWSRTVPGSTAGELVVEDSLVVGSFADDQRLETFEAATGEDHFAYDDHDWLGGVNAPAIDDGTVYGQLSVDDEAVFAAIDLETADRVWTTQLSGRIVVAPAVADDRLYLVTWDEPWVYALDTATGDVLWSAETVGNPRPIAADEELVYLVTGSQLSAFDRDDGSEGWSIEFDESIGLAPAVSEEVVAAVTGEAVVGIDENGDSRWTHSLSTTPTSLACHSEAVYVGTSDETVAIDAETGSERWRADARGETALTLADETLYAAGTTVLAALDRDTGDQRWQLTVEKRLTRSPIPLDDRLLVSTETAGGGDQDQETTIQLLEP